MAHFCSVALMFVGVHNHVNGFSAAGRYPIKLEGPASMHDSHIVIDLILFHLGGVMQKGPLCPKSVSLSRAHPSFGMTPTFGGKFFSKKKEKQKEKEKRKKKR